MSRTVTRGSHGEDGRYVDAGNEERLHETSSSGTMTYTFYGAYAGWYLYLKADLYIHK